MNYELSEQVKKLFSQKRKPLLHEGKQIGEEVNGLLCANDDFLFPYDSPCIGYCVKVYKKQEGHWEVICFIDSIDDSGITVFFPTFHQEEKARTAFEKLSQYFKGLRFQPPSQEAFTKAMNAIGAHPDWY